MTRPRARGRQDSASLFPDRATGDSGGTVIPVTNSAMVSSPDGEREQASNSEESPNREIHEQTHENRTMKSRMQMCLTSGCAHVVQQLVNITHVRSGVR